MRAICFQLHSGDRKDLQVEPDNSSPAAINAGQPAPFALKFAASPIYGAGNHLNCRPNGDRQNVGKGMHRSISAG